MNNQSEIKNSSLSELLNKNIKVANLFYTYNIDFLSNPNQPLQVIISEKQIASNKILNEIVKILDNGDPVHRIVKKNLNELIEYIINNHHTYVRNALPNFADKLKHIEFSFSKVQEIKYQFDLLTHDLSSHLEKEERVLFPLIKYLVDTEKFHERPKTRNYGTVRNPIRQMLLDHETSLVILKKMKSILTEIRKQNRNIDVIENFDILIKEFECDLQKHIHLENNVLFPKTIELETKLLHN